MQITIGLWAIPLLMTLIMTGIMIRPYQRSGDYDFGSVFRILWVIPILIVWLLYFAFVAWKNSR